MDDPTRRCENDAGNETRLLGPPIPSGGPFSYPSVSTSASAPSASYISTSIYIQLN
jgi:hypothetical protein